MIKRSCSKGNTEKSSWIAWQYGPSMWQVIHTLDGIINQDMWQIMTVWAKKLYTWLTDCVLEDKSQVMNYGDAQHALRSRLWVLLPGSVKIQLFTRSLPPQLNLFYDNNQISCTLRGCIRPVVALVFLTLVQGQGKTSSNWLKVKPSGVERCYPTDPYFGQ